MTSEAKQTEGLHLVRMGLVRSSLEAARPLILDPVNQQAIEQQAGARSALDINVAQRHEFGPQAGQVAVFLSVEAIVKAKNEVLAVAQCEYVAFYVLGQKCEITQQQLIDTFAPAHLYAFCREHIADLARRAGGTLLLPPAHFAVIAPDAKAANQTS